MKTENLLDDVVRKGMEEVDAMVREGLEETWGPAVTAQNAATTEDWWMNGSILGFVILTWFPTSLLFVDFYTAIQFTMAVVLVMFFSMLMGDSTPSRGLNGERHWAGGCDPGGG